MSLNPDTTIQVNGLTYSNHPDDMAFAHIVEFWRNRRRDIALKAYSNREYEYADHMESHYWGLTNHGLI